MKAGCSGLGLGAGLPRLLRALGSALPPVRSSSTSGKLTPQAVFAFTCLVCKDAWRGRFQSQPQTAAIHSPFPCSRVRFSPRRGRRAYRHPEAGRHPSGFAWAVSWQGDARVRQSNDMLSPDAFPFGHHLSLHCRGSGEPEGKTVGRGGQPPP